jgi:hypothetical protein
LILNEWKIVLKLLVLFIYVGKGDFEIDLDWTKFNTVTESVDLDLDRLEFDRLEFDRLEFDRLEFDRLEFDRLEFDRLEFDRLEFENERDLFLFLDNVLDRNLFLFLEVGLDLWYILLSFLL